MVTQRGHFLSLPCASIRRAAELTSRPHQDCVFRGPLTRVFVPRYASVVAGHNAALLRVVAFMSELRDHRLDVSECTVCGINSCLVFLSCFNLDLNLLSCLLGKLLHVTFNKVNLGVEISVTDVSVFHFLLQLEVSQL